MTKKRFILGRSLGQRAKVFHGNTRVTADTENEMEFWLPKGVNRFHFMGGSRFFHGGATLQEIVIPLLTVKELGGKTLEKFRVRKVGISLIGTNKKIVTNRHVFKFIQTDAVRERVHPLILNIAIMDGDEPVSSEETVTFDSRSDAIDDRKQKVILTLKSKQFVKNRDYFLVMRDAETEIEYDRIPVTIDLAILSDF